MHSLRRARKLAVSVLAWFVLSLGVALLAPAFAGGGLPQEICSVDTDLQASHEQDDQGGQVPGHVVHCPACLLTAAPPPPEVVAAVHLHAPAVAPAVPSRSLPPEAPRAAWTARGPPSLS